jgi:hypothetical protein
LEGRALPGDSFLGLLAGSVFANYMLTPADIDPLTLPPTDELIDVSCEALLSRPQLVSRSMGNTISALDSGWKAGRTDTESPGDWQSVGQSLSQAVDLPFQSTGSNPLRVANQSAREFRDRVFSDESWWAAQFSALGRGIRQADSPALPGDTSRRIDSDNVPMVDSTLDELAELAITPSTADETGASASVLELTAGEPALAQPVLLSPDGTMQDGEQFDEGGPAFLMGGSCCCTTEARDDEAWTYEDQPVLLHSLLNNDHDPELDTLVITEITQPDHGSALLRPDQIVVYSPPANWSGETVFDYTISDMNGNFSTASVTLIVTPENDRPSASAILLETSEDTPGLVTFAASDVENEPLSFYVVDGPSHGTLGALVGNQITYYPDGNYAGDDSFRYAATDGHVSGEPATVDLEVLPMADPPGVTITPTSGSTNVSEGFESGESYSMVLNTAPAADVIVSIDAGSQLLASPSTVVFTLSDWATPQVVALEAVDDLVAEATPQAALVTHSSASLDPAYSGIAIASVNVWISDNEIPQLYRLGSELPVEITEGGGAGSYFVALGSQPLFPVSVALTSDAQVTLSPSAIAFDSVNWALPREVIVQAVEDSIGEGYHLSAVTHSMSSQDPMYDGETMVMNVALVDNDGPTARLDTFDDLSEDVEATLDVLNNDAGEGLTIIEATGASDGSLTIVQQGTRVRYSPNADFYGDDRFTYRVRDAEGLEAMGAVRVWVKPVNDRPVFVNPPGLVVLHEDEEEFLPVAADDVDGDALAFAVFPPDIEFNGLPPGLYVDYLSGIVTGIVSSTAEGEYLAVLLVHDFLGGEQTTTLAYSVLPTNHAPTVGDPDDRVNRQGDPVDLIIPTHDVDGQPVTSVAAIGLPAGVTVQKIGDAWKLIGPIAQDAEIGAYEVTLTATDQGGLTGTNSFVWTVRGQNDPVPRVTFALNGTIEPPDRFESDDITLLWAGDREQLDHEDLPATVSLVYDSPGPHIVTFEVSPPGRVELNIGSAVMLSGWTIDLTITPKAASQQVYDVKITAIVDGMNAGSEDFTIVNASLPHIRHDDTPVEYDASQDRIPPASPNSFTDKVSWSPDLEGLQSVVFEKVLSGDPSVVGDFEVPPLPIAVVGDCAPGENVALLVLDGTVQTAPSLDANGKNDLMGSNRGGLKLGARVRGARLHSNPFSVTAIPIAAIGGMPQVLQGTNLNGEWTWGLNYPITFASDDLGDPQTALDEVFGGEQLFDFNVLGAFEGFRKHEQEDWLPITAINADSLTISRVAPTRDKALRDLIDTFLNDIGTPSLQTLEQRIVFNDTRVGLVGPGVPLKGAGAPIRWSGSYLVFAADQEDDVIWISIRREPLENHGALAAVALHGKPHMVGLE